MNPARATIVAAAEASIARGSKSFGVASRLFDRPTRERAWLLYAWCRACDDLADGQDHGHDATAVSDPQARLATIRARTDAALAGKPTGEAAFDALGIVAAETGLPHRLAHDLIAGFALDSDGWQPQGTDDLLRYCYHVAGTVGCMMAVVMGVAPGDDAVLDRACDLGIAFQLANIARDIGEDAGIGRCYLPADWLAELRIPRGEHMRGEFRPQLAMLAGRLADLSRGYAASGRAGTPALPFRAAWAVLAAAGIYGGIGFRVAKAGTHAWDERIGTPAVQKLGWIGRAFAQTTARRRLFPPVPRDGLWNRPRG